MNHHYPRYGREKGSAIVPLQHLPIDKFGRDVLHVVRVAFIPSYGAAIRIKKPKAHSGASQTSIVWDTACGGISLLFRLHDFAIRLLFPSQVSQMLQKIWLLIHFLDFAPFSVAHYYVLGGYSFNPLLRSCRRDRIITGDCNGHSPAHGFKTEASGLRLLSWMCSNNFHWGNSRAIAAFTWHCPFCSRSRFTFWKNRLKLIQCCWHGR